MTVAFLANHIRNYFGDGSDFGVRMRYATEESPLGTAGSVRNAMDELDETFLVISGDVLTDIDLERVRRGAPRRSGASASIALKRVENPVEFGIVITRDDGTIERFLEKPTWGEVFSDTINTGIYVLEPDVFDFIPEGEVVDFSERRVPGGARTRAARCTATSSTATGRTSARSRRTARAHEDVLDGRVQVDIDGFQLGDGVWLGEGVDDQPRRPRSRARCSSATTAASRPARVLRPVHRARRRRRREGRRASSSARVVHDHVYIGPRRATCAAR